MYPMIQKMLLRHPGTVPVILHSRSCVLRKHKFLIPNEVTLGEFTFLLRSYLTNVSERAAIFLFLGEDLPYQTCTMEALFRDHQKDHVLNMSVEMEDVFGSPENILC